MREIDLGAVSAYAMAKEYGYTGTEEEFAIILANAANYAAEAKEAKGAAENSASEAETHKNSAVKILEDVNTAGAEQISAIENAAAEKTEAAKQEIAQKGAETLNSIPEDYTTLQGDVNGLKGDLTKLEDILNIEYVASTPTEYYELPNKEMGVADDGTLYSKSGYDASDYIELKGLYGICRVVSSTTKFNLSRLAFYDENKNFIKFVDPMDNYEFSEFNGKTVVWLPINESAVYVRFDSKNTGVFNYWIVESYETDILDTYCTIDSIFNRVNGDNIFDPSTMTNAGFYYDFADGKTEISEVGVLITKDFINVGLISALYVRHNYVGSGNPMFLVYCYNDND